MSERKPNWKAVVAAPNFAGGIIKAAEDIALDVSRFNRNWPAITTAGGDRYGTTWFRGIGVVLFPTLADFQNNEIDRSAKRN